MKIQIDKIYEGWRNHLFPSEHLKRVINNVARKRRNICNVCEHNSVFHSTFRPDVHCTICDCTLIAKTKCLSCECPDNRWKAMVTEEEEEEMLNEKKGV